MCGHIFGAEFVQNLNESWSRLETSGGRYEFSAHFIYQFIDWLEKNLISMFEKNAVQNNCYIVYLWYDKDENNFVAVEREELQKSKRLIDEYKYSLESDNKI